MFLRTSVAAGLLSAVLVAGPATAGDTKSEIYTFGSLKSVSAETARTQALDWLSKVGKTDEATRKQFDAIWSHADRCVLDKVAETLALDPATAKLIKSINDITTNVPKDVPAEIKDRSKPNFYRANLALVFAKSISSRRVYEEALEALKLVKPEDVVDPSAYFFH